MAGEAARDLERGRAELIYTVTTQVTVAAKQATAQTPIVFYVGVDPVAEGLVESLAKPGGRLTGFHGLSRDLTVKRLEVLKEIVPKLGRVVTFYDTADAVAKENARATREAARALGIQLVERPVDSIEALRSGLQRLTSRDAQAYFHTQGAIVTSQALLIVEAARVKRLPSMFHETNLATSGGLAAYGQNYREIGRMSARYVQRILTGTAPKNLPVENYDKIELAINLRTAREIGLTIPASVRLRADTVIQ